jgi:hypothetical protein
LTKEANLLLGVANHFYRKVPGDFLVLAIDSKQLTSKVTFLLDWTLCRVGS